MLFKYFSYWFPTFLLDGQERRGLNVTKYGQANGLRLGSLCGNRDVRINYEGPEMLLVQYRLIF
jgi:hypothetical protein